MMKIDNNTIKTSPGWLAQRGFSLIEVMLILAMLSATILPFMLVTNQTAQNARGIYLQASRSILMNSLMDEATPDRNNYVTNYTKGTAGSLMTSISESNQVLPWRTVVDSTNANATDTFVKTVYFYLYTNATDAANAPRLMTKWSPTRTTMRVHFDSSRLGFMDASGFWWEPWDTYSAVNDVPGISSASPVRQDSSTATVNMPSHRDAKLYEDGWWTVSANSTFTAPVPNGLYTVKLYFSENNQAGRLMDIKLQGSLMNPGVPYNAYYYCSNQFYCGNVQMFDVFVDNNTLTIDLSANSNASHLSPFIRSISIKRRTE